MQVLRNLFRLLLVLWAGSLWSLAIWVAPTLFYVQSDRHLAGVLAARLFTVETYLGIAVAVLALLLPGRTRFFWLYFAAAVLTVNELILKRWMSLALSQGHAAGLSFGAWHGVGAALYVMACLAALVLVWKQDLR
jgi:hypothetical protein